MTALLLMPVAQWISSTLSGLHFHMVTRPDGSVTYQTAPSVPESRSSGADGCPGSSGREAPDNAPPVLHSRVVLRANSSPERCPAEVEMAQQPRRRPVVLQRAGRQPDLSRKQDARCARRTFRNSRDSHWFLPNSV